MQPLQLISNQERDPCSFSTPFHQRRSAGACGLKQLTHLQTPSELLTEGQVQGEPRDWMPQWRIWSWLWWIWGHIHNMKSCPWTSSIKALISLLPLWLALHTCIALSYRLLQTVVPGSWRRSREAWSGSSLSSDVTWTWHERCNLIAVAAILFALSIFYYPYPSICPGSAACVFSMAEHPAGFQAKVCWTNWPPPWCPC